MAYNSEKSMCDIFLERERSTLSRYAFLTANTNVPITNNNSGIPIINNQGLSKLILFITIHHPICHMNYG